MVLVSVSISFICLYPLDLISLFYFYLLESVIITLALCFNSVQLDSSDLIRFLLIHFNSARYICMKYIKSILEHYRVCLLCVSDCYRYQSVSCSDPVVLKGPNTQRSSCLWHLKAPEGSQLELRVEWLLPECRDRLAIYDSLVPADSTLITSWVLQKFLKGSAYKNTPQIYKLNRNSLFIRLTLKEGLCFQTLSHALVEWYQTKQWNDSSFQPFYPLL